MKKWCKKEIMEHLDSLITEAFECDHISVTFPNDNMVRIELTNNDSEKEQLYHLSCPSCGKDWWDREAFPMYCPYCSTNRKPRKEQRQK